MIKQNKKYSSIKSHKELIKAITDINQEIRFQSQVIDSSIASVRYKYSLAHLMEIMITKYQFVYNTYTNVSQFLKRIKIKKENHETNQTENYETNQTENYETNQEPIYQNENREQFNQNNF